MKKTAAAVVGCIMLLTGTGIQKPVYAQTLTSDTQNYYAEWKTAFLRKNPYSEEEQYYVFYGEETYEEAHETVPVTVSEAHGYGMLISVLMADYDSDAKQIFDGMYRYYQAHPSSIGPHLMAWQQSDNGSALIDTDGSDSATDGDLDIAYALLLADMVWGSSGVNYRQAAKDLINDIMEYEVNHVYWVPQLGDWAHDPDEASSTSTGGRSGWGDSSPPFNEDYPYTDAVRSSDLIMQYFPVFSAVTGDERWLSVYNASNSLIHEKTAFSLTGMLPDFCVRHNAGIGGWTWATSNFLESAYDGAYYYNACRTPWRIGTDALLNVNEESQIYAEKVNAWIKESCGGDPEEIRAGYELTRGRPVSNRNDLCFTAPLMISAKAAGDAEFHDAIRENVIATGIDDYYGSTIAMLCMITDDGGWLIPNTDKRPGDVNLDYTVNISDAYYLRIWLLAKPHSVLRDWEAGDLNDDGKLNAVDMTLLRRLIPKKDVYTHTVIVQDTESLFNAVRNAFPGTVIKLAPGTYNLTEYQGAQKIDTTAAGTADAPITLTASDPDDPPVLKGNSTENGYVLHIQGDYWILDHLICTTAQKGIVLDHSSHTVIQNCEIRNTGAEAIALRDGSSYCTVQSCNIHDTGKVSPGYGEGVYIGSAYSTTGFDYKCDYNKVLDCIFRNIAAEHVDVKEFTTGTEIGGCTFYGDGMTGENYAGSFIDIAGNNCLVHDNTGYRNQNPKIVAAFEIHDQADGWGYHHTFENNTLYMDREYGEQDTGRRMYVVDGWFSDFTVKHNLVDYGSGLEEAKPEYYNSDTVTFAD